MISGPEAVAWSARPFSECANDSGHYTYIIVISLTFVKCFLEKSSALPGQMGAKFRQNEEDAEGKKKLAGFVRVSKGYPEEQRREKAEICRVASCILILGEESAIISMLSIQQNAPVCRNGRRGGLKIPCVISKGDFEKLRIDAGFRAFLGQRKRSIPPEHPSNLPNQLLLDIVDASRASTDNP